MTSSLVICTKDRAADLMRAVASVLAQTHRPDELVIVDSGSDTTVPERLERLTTGQLSLRYLHSEPGLTHQRNVGVSGSVGEIILFLDDDAVIEPDYVQAVLQAFDDRTGGAVQAVTGRITNVNCPWVAANWREVLPCVFRKAFNTVFLLNDLGRGAFKVSGHSTSTFLLDRRRDVQCLGGGMMSFRREVFEHCSFDETFTGYCAYEDNDISRQLMHLGMRAVYLPEARLAHYPSRTSRTAKPELGLMLARNLHYLQCKHGKGTCGERLSLLWALCGMTLAALLTRDWAKARGLMSGLAEVARGQNPLTRHLKGEGALDSGSESAGDGGL